MTPERRFFKRPGKKETLASKQEEKVRRWRLNHLRKGLAGLSSQWWVRAGEALGIVVLFLTNFLPFV